MKINKIILTSGVIIMNALNIKSIEIPSYKNIDFKPERISPIKLENGIKIYLKRDPSLPTIRITAFIKTGKVYDPADKAGMGELFFELLREGGSKKFKAEEIDRKLEYLGAEINTSINNEDASISMYSHKKNFDEVFEIFLDLIKNPSFEKEKFELKKQEQIEMIKRRNDNPERMAQREAIRMFFSKDHPYGRRPEIETIERITIDDLKEYYNRFIKPSNIILSVAGDFNEEEMRNRLKAEFANLKENNTTKEEIKEPPEFKGRKIYVVDKPLRQSFIVIIQKGPRRHDDREFPLSVLTEYMGGGIQSRLGNEIRSRRGLAYTIYSYFSKRDKAGFIMTYLGTKPETTAESIEYILKELSESKNKIDQKEFEMSKSQLINSFVFRFESTAMLLNEIASYDLFGYSPDYIRNYTEKIDKVTVDDVLKTANEFYDLNNYVIFIVGDYKKFKDNINRFGEVEVVKEI